MWYRNSYRFSPFYKSIGEIIIQKTLSKPPPKIYVDHKYESSLKSLARLQFGNNKKGDINKITNSSKSKMM